MTRNTGALPLFQAGPRLPPDGNATRDVAAGRQPAAPSPAARAAIPDCVPLAARSRLGLRTLRLLRADY